MNVEEKARAFEPFFTTKDVGKGTGLGLSMVYGFAQQSGGFAHIESEPGQGTTVRLYLPRMAPSVERQSGTDHPPQPGGGSEISPKIQADTDRSTILLVEDDPDIRDALRDQIVGLGYNVVVASDGTEALSQSEYGQRIDLLFTDIVMPGDCAVACRH